MPAQKILSQQRECGTCGKKFTVSGNKQAARTVSYCSRTCYANQKSTWKELGDHEWLEEMYLVAELTTREIAAMLGCSGPMVVLALRKASIPLRTAGARKRKPTKRTCPICDKVFLVGGRGRPNVRQMCCANECSNKLKRPHKRRATYPKRPEMRGPNYHENKKVQHQNIYRFHKYGLNGVEYAAMLRAQGGVCAACKQPETRVHGETVTCLSVDHDHKTGKVRGLLCHKCNVAIGCARDKRENLLSLVEYLDKHNEKEAGEAQ